MRRGEERKRWEVDEEEDPWKPSAHLVQPTGGRGLGNALDFSPEMDKSIRAAEPLAISNGDWTRKSSYLPDAVVRVHDPCSGLFFREIRDRSRDTSHKLCWHKWIHYKH